MDFLQIVLFPIISVMRIVLEAANAVTHSYGISIIFLAVFVTIATTPIASYATRLQIQENELQARMRPRVQEAKSRHKGEAQFLEIEKIYNDFNYHPIKSVRTVAGLALQVPFLLSALVLLVTFAPLDGESFGYIDDLSRSDRLIGLPFEASFLPAYINLLPVVLIMVNIIESFVSPNTTTENLPKTLFISGVLFLLVYPLPASVTLYWLSTNFLSLLRSANLRQNASKGHGHE